MDEKRTESCTNMFFRKYENDEKLSRQEESNTRRGARILTLACSLPHRIPGATLASYW